MSEEKLIVELRRERETKRWVVYAEEDREVAERVTAGSLYVLKQVIEERGNPEVIILTI